MTQSLGWPIGYRTRLTGLVTVQRHLVGMGRWECPMDVGAAQHPGQGVLGS